jgi:hypothetical protein
VVQQPFLWTRLAGARDRQEMGFEVA